MNLITDYRRQVILARFNMSFSSQTQKLVRHDRQACSEKLFCTHWPFYSIVNFEKKTTHRATSQRTCVLKWGIEKEHGKHEENINKTMKQWENYISIGPKQSSSTKFMCTCPFHRHKQMSTCITGGREKGGLSVAQRYTPHGRALYKDPDTGRRSQNPQILDKDKKGQS